MEESILKSVKKILGIYPDDDSFDLDVITHINSAFSVLHQLGVGPADGFYIEDEEAEWADFGPELETPIIREVQTVVYLRVRLLFDPPTTSYAIAALERQIVEHEWRVNVQRENLEWVDPDPPGPPVVMNGE
jgi:hypothetical protein